MSNVLVTGTSSGFGFLTSKTLVEQGHTVFATMRDPNERNAEPAAALRDAAAGKSGKLHVLHLDVTDERSVESAVQEAIATAGHLDVAVNNAGVLTGGYIEGFTIEQFRALLDINLFGVHRVCRAVLPHMRERKQGLILNVSSSLGRYVLPYMGIYIASKFAVEGYSDVLAVETAPFNVQVAIVEPGAFPTGVFARIMYPTDQARLATYGELADAPGQLFAGFAQMMATNGPNPQLVADKIAEVIATPADKRPARSVVDLPWGQFTEAINEAAAKAQGGVFASMQGGG